MAALDATDDEISAAALAQLQAWLQQRPTWKHKPRLARRARRSASTPPAQQRRVFFDAAAGDDDERWGAASDGDDDGLAVEDEAKRYAASLMLPAQLDLFCEKNKLSALRRKRRLSNRSYREEMAPLGVLGAIRPTNVPNLTLLSVQRARDCHVTDEALCALAHGCPIIGNDFVHETEFMCGLSVNNAFPHHEIHCLCHSKVLHQQPLPTFIR